MMGCGVSSNRQITPINTESPIFSNREIQVSATSKKIIEINQTATTTQPRILLNKFNLISILPCRISGNDSAEVKSAKTLNFQLRSLGVQTESDVFGFKSQYAQTDSMIMNDQEFTEMVKELEKEQENGFISEINNGEDKAKKENNDDDDDNADEELFNCRKKYQEILEKNKINDEKQFINVGVQVTKRKMINSTQTKFGSIDHQFVPNSFEFFVKSTKLLEETLGETINQKLSNLLAYFENEDQQNENILLENSDQVFSIDETSIVDDTEKIINCPKKIMPCDQISEIPVSLNDNHQSPDRVKKLWARKSQKFLKQQKIEDCLSFLLKDIQNRNILEIPQSTNNTSIVNKRDIALQTTNDILTDEAPEFSARAPLCHKNEIIPSALMFHEIDKKMLEATSFSTPQEIAHHVNKYAKNDLFKIRGTFIWIAKNIKLSLETTNRKMTSKKILESGEAASQSYCQLFSDVCRKLGIRVKTIEGFVRDKDFKPGHNFSPERDLLNSWNAVFVLSSWRFIDLTLAAGSIDLTGEFHQKTNEHFFFTDPSALIWTHFPYNDIEKNYERWQLLDKPLTLDEFNALPKVTENFFEYNLVFRSKIQNSSTFRISTEVKIGSHEAMRYKYKLYLSDEIENPSLNHYVFCQLKEDRLVGSFMIQPPIEGRFLMKIFAKPEREMLSSQQDLTIVLNPVITMLIECQKAKKYIEPLPINDLPWGPTQKFFDYKLKFINQKGPVIVTWGGRRRLILECNETMLITYSLFDSESMEMDTRTIISREDNGLKTIFTFNPPRIGAFKFILFGMPKPKQKGKWRLPLLATLMIDCKLIKPTQHDDDIPSLTNNIVDEKK